MMSRAIYVTSWVLLAFGMLIFYDLGGSLGASCPNEHPPSATHSTTTEKQERCGIEQSATYRTAAAFVHLIEHGEKFLIALSTVFIAVFTVVLGVATAALWKATRALSDGADETAKRQLRAYVGQQGVFFDVTSNQNGYAPITAANMVPAMIFSDFTNVTLKNFGQTPAYDVCNYIALISIAPAGATLPSDFDFDAAIHNNQSGVNIVARSLLNKDQAEITKAPLLNANDVWNAQARRSTLFIAGRIYYRDTFGRNWSTKFCLVWEPWHGAAGRFVPHNQFNGEDQREPP